MRASLMPEKEVNLVSISLRKILPWIRKDINNAGPFGQISAGGNVSADDQRLVLILWRSLW